MMSISYSSDLGVICYGSNFVDKEIILNVSKYLEHCYVGQPQSCTLSKKAWGETDLPVNSWMVLAISTAAPGSII
jgi:hypothetical protein